MSQKSIYERYLLTPQLKKLTERNTMLNTINNPNNTTNILLDHYFTPLQTQDTKIKSKSKTLPKPKIVLQYSDGSDFTLKGEWAYKIQNDKITFRLIKSLKKVPAKGISVLTTEKSIEIKLNILYAFEIYSIKLGKLSIEKIVL